MKKIVLLVAFVIILGVSALFFLNIRKDDEEIKKENNIKKNNIDLLIDDRIDNNNHNNTVDQVQDLLNKIGDQSLKLNGNIEEDDVDEDVENYLKSLESK